VLSDGQNIHSNKDEIKAKDDSNLHTIRSRRVDSQAGESHSCAKAEMQAGLRWL
jgi:hypothetical protein